VAYPDEFGEPIPTLRWEAMRDGIDDVRYLQALDRAIAKGEQRQGPPSRRRPWRRRSRRRGMSWRHFDAIDGRWFNYLMAIDGRNWKPRGARWLRRLLAWRRLWRSDEGNQ